MTDLAVPTCPRCRTNGSVEHLPNPVRRAEGAWEWFCADCRMPFMGTDSEHERERARAIAIERERNNQGEQL